MEMEGVPGTFLWASVEEAVAVLKGRYLDTDLFLQHTPKIQDSVPSRLLDVTDTLRRCFGDFI